MLRLRPFMAKNNLFLKNGKRIKILRAFISYPASAVIGLLLAGPSGIILGPIVRASNGGKNWGWWILVLRPVSLVLSLIAPTVNVSPSLFISPLNYSSSELTKKETISTKLTGSEWAGAGMLIARKNCHLEKGDDPQIVEDWFEEAVKDSLELDTEIISADRAVQILSKAMLPIFNEQCSFSLKDLESANSELYKRYGFEFSDGRWKPANVKSD